MQSSTPPPRTEFLRNSNTPNAEADTVIYGMATVTTTVLVPSEALAHAKSCLPALEVIFKSAVPKDSGFTIQPGFVNDGSYNLQLETIGKGYYSEQPAWQFVMTLFLDKVVELGDLESWPRLFEINLTDDNGESLQKISTKGTVLFKYDSPNATARIEHFVTSTKTTHTPTTFCPTDWRLELPSRETYVLVHVLVGTDAGTSFVPPNTTPWSLSGVDLTETIRPSLTLRLAGRVFSRLRGLSTPQNRTGWPMSLNVFSHPPEAGKFVTESVLYQRNLFNPPNLLWKYPILVKLSGNGFPPICLLGSVSNPAVGDY
ncbi:hypothetical protein Hypma_004677 [Hypsizygus marmoreus]|uniref:Uncharacterized protein n=1 Tax=Hypsizygus marmoreus TaxID=39966 RepID=A0A369J1S8_HYPMA|nr:hypothetical protein Hypma_004677 [Hypsizygus marmoreus]